MIAAPDDATKDSPSLAMFEQELDGLKQTLNPLPNFGYFMPWARNDFIANHQVTAVSFTGSGIHEHGIDADIGTFVDNLLNQQDPAETPVMKAFRTQQGSDFTFSTFLAWIDSIFNLTGEAGPISGTGRDVKRRFAPGERGAARRPRVAARLRRCVAVRRSGVTLRLHHRNRRRA